MEEKRQMEIKKLKPGTYVLIDGDVYVVDKLQVSKSGKHGSAKARIMVSGVFSDKKQTIVKPSDTMMDVPIIEKKAAQVIAVMGDIVQLMDLQDYSTFNVPMQETMKDLQSGDEVIIWKFGNNVIVKGKK